MKKVTLLALALGMTFGVFAQNFTIGAKNDSQFKAPQGRTVSVQNVKGAAVKAGEATISEATFEESAETWMTAKFTVTPSDNAEKIAVLVLQEGSHHAYIDSMGYSAGFIFGYYDQQAYQGQLFQANPKSAQEFTQGYLAGGFGYEIWVGEVVNGDTTLVWKTITTPKYEKMLNGVADAEIDVSDITDNGCFVRMTMNDQTYQYFYTITTKDWLLSIGWDGSYDDQTWTNVMVRLANYGYAKAANQSVQGPVGGDDSEQQLEEGVAYVVGTVAVNGNFEIGKVHAVEFTPGEGVGLEELINNAQVSVYPNPASERVVVSSLAPISNVEIVNTLGQVVYSNNTVANGYNIPVSSFEKGTYFVKVRTADKVSTQKVVIK